MFATISLLLLCTPRASSALRLALCVAGLERSLLNCIGSLNQYVLKPLKADVYILVQTVPSRYSLLLKSLRGINNTMALEISIEDSIPLMNILLEGHALNMTWMNRVLLDHSEKQPHAALYMWRRWSRCQDLISEQEVRTGNEYDYVAFTRSDLHWYASIPSLRVVAEAAQEHCINEKRAVFALEGEEYAGVNDRFFIVHRSHAHVIGGFLWEVVSSARSLDAALQGILFRYPLRRSRSCNAETLTHLLLLSADMCVLKFSSVAALDSGDNSPRYSLEFSSAKFFADIINAGAQWAVVRTPFLSGARCRDLPLQCCADLQFAGSRKCWLEYYRKPVKIYSILRCCSRYFVHVAPMPTLNMLQKAAAFIRQRIRSGIAVDPQASQITSPSLENTLHWWCSPCQPEDVVFVPFLPSQGVSLSMKVTETFGNLPIGSLQCYNLDHLLSLHGYYPSSALTG